MSTTRQRLLREITAMEKQISGSSHRQSQETDERAVLAAEIRDLEQKINNMGKVSSYMDDDLMEDDMGGMDDMAYMDDGLMEDDMGDMDDMAYMDEEDDMDDADYMADPDHNLSPAEASVMASETDPSGIEEDIDQDFLDEMARLRGKLPLADAKSMLKVAPTRSEYQRKLASASGRLDRVAQYLETNGRTKLAFRIDKIADAIDERLAQIGGNNDE